MNHIDSQFGRRFDYRTWEFHKEKNPINPPHQGMRGSITNPSKPSDIHSKHILWCLYCSRYSCGSGHMMRKPLFFTIRNVIWVLQKCQDGSVFHTEVLPGNYTIMDTCWLETQNQIELDTVWKLILLPGAPKHQSINSFCSIVLKCSWTWVLVLCLRGRDHELSLLVFLLSKTYV